MRTVKKPQERRSEILDCAARLFHTKGYTKTTINDILNEIGIAKGTFYHYFKSKEEVLDAIIERVVDNDVSNTEKIVNDPSLSVFDKLFQTLMGQTPDEGEVKDQMIEQMQHPNNAEMYQKALVQSVNRMVPLLTRIVDQGIEEDLMKSQYPKETMEFLLVSGQIMFDNGLFPMEPEEQIQKVKAFIHVMEITLGVEEGTLDFMSRILT